MAQFVVVLLFVCLVLPLIMAVGLVILFWQVLVLVARCAEWLYNDWTRHRPARSAQ